MNNEWETPDDLYNALSVEFGFDFDLCANESNAKTIEYSTNAIETAHLDDLPWKRFFMNPPYSRGSISECMLAALKIHDRGKTVVALVRFDPSAKWYQEYVHGIAREVRMLSRRVKFKAARSAYNFPCCIAVYDWKFQGMSKTNYILWDWKS